MYEVYIGYAGIPYYIVYKDGKRIYYGWSETEIKERTGTSVDDMKRIREDRYNG